MWLETFRISCCCHIIWFLIIKLLTYWRVFIMDPFTNWVVYYYDSCYFRLFEQYGSCYVIQDSFTPKILRNFHFGIRLSSHKLSIHFLSAELILNRQLTIGNIRVFTELTIVAIWSDINPNHPIEGYYRWLLPCITCLCTPSMGGTNLFC